MNYRSQGQGKNGKANVRNLEAKAGAINTRPLRPVAKLGLWLMMHRVAVQGGGAPAQNIYQCRVQEDKAVAAASRKTSQTENDHTQTLNIYQCRVQEDKAVAAASRKTSQTENDHTQTLNGNNVITKPTSSHSLSSYHSQVSVTR